MVTAKAPKTVRRNIVIEEDVYYDLKIAMAIERTSLQKLSAKLLKEWLAKHPVARVVNKK